MLFTVDEAADYTRLSKITLNRWRLTGEGPVFVKMGGAVRYAKADLDAFIAASRRRATTSFLEARDVPVPQWEKLA